MTKVGADKRLRYYQLSGDEVIAELRSHRYGLTAPEAKRRLAQNGANLISSADPRGERLRPVVQPWLLALLVLGVAGAWYLDNQWLVAVLTLLALLSILSDAWREHSRDNLEHNVRQLLPAKTTVRRNDMAQVIDATELVVGDIVQLETGMQVPADVRVLQTDKLLVDDSVLFANGHNHKFAHAVVSDLPLAQQHNLAFAGTSVLSGSGSGIVIAAGMQTELGRIVTQANATRPKSSLFHHSFYQLTRRFAWITMGLFLLLGIVIAKSTLEFRDGATYGLAIVISLLPVGLGFAAIRMFSVFGQRARWQGLTAGSNSVADRLGSIDTLLLDEADITVESVAVATGFMVGKKHYKPASTQLTPSGKLLGDAGKPLTQKALGELELFFHALALSTHTRLLPPDSDHTEWHVAGPAVEGALVALAAQAGINTDELRRQHPQVSHNTYDYSRQLASTIHDYNHRQLLFVHGSSSAVLARADRIWDAGHTRKLTAADRTKFDEYYIAQTGIGDHVVAIAYQQLAQKVDVVSLSATDVEKDLIILGFVSVGQPVKQAADLALKSVRTSGVAVSFISNRSAIVASSALKQLGVRSPDTVPGRDLLQLSDSQLLELLIAGNTVFMHLTPEQRLRLVDVAERAKRHIAVTGAGLADVPALRHASIALCIASASRAVSEEADLIVTSGDLHSFTRTFGRSREISAHLKRIMHSTLADHSIQLWLVLISLGFYLSDRIPLATTATLLLVATLLHSLAFAAISDDASGRREAPTSLAPHPSVVNIGLGLLGGLLVCINFVYFFVRANLSPSYINGSSNLYLQAATLGFVTLVLCMWINLLFSRAQHTTNLLSHQLRNKTLLQVFGLTTLTVLALVYSKPIQNVVGTRGLSLADWLCALLIALIYFAIRMLAHTERRRSRSTVVALHHQAHGKDSGAKI